MGVAIYDVTTFRKNQFRASKLVSNEVAENWVMQEHEREQNPLYKRILDIFDADEFLFSSAQLMIAVWNKEIQQAMRQRHSEESSRTKVGIPVLDLSWAGSPAGEFPETTLRLRFACTAKWRIEMGLQPLGYLDTTLGPDFEAYKLAPVLALTADWERKLIVAQVCRARKMQRYLTHVWEIDGQLRQNLIQMGVEPESSVSEPRD